MNDGRLSFGFFWLFCFFFFVFCFVFLHGTGGFFDTYVVDWKACMVHGIMEVKTFTLGFRESL